MKHVLFLLIIIANSWSAAAQNLKPVDVVNRYYRGWELLSAMKDHSTGDAQNIECNINECTQGGDDCASKSQVSMPREIDFLNGNGLKGSITIGPYINDFEGFVANMNAKFTFQSPVEIASIKGAGESLEYRCFTVTKNYSWGKGSKQLTDTLWVKTSINRISGVRNEYGGSRQVSSASLANPTELNTFSVSDLEIQASTYYDKGDYESALKLYREVSLKDWSNVDANFYTFLMEGQNKGCKEFSRKYYQREAAWWYIKHLLNDKFKAGASVYNIDEKITEFRKLGMPYFPDTKKMSIFDALYRNPEADASKLAFIYSTMLPVSCGLMVNCNSKNKYGFINVKGDNAIDYLYDIAYGFSDNGLALVVKNGKCGYINTKGAVAIPFKYELAQTAFYNGHAFCIENGILKIIDASGNVVKTIQTDKQYKIHPIYRTKKYALAEYYDNDSKKTMWDVFDYDGNIIVEGCTECFTRVGYGVIELMKDGKSAAILDYKCNL